MYKIFYTEYPFRQTRVSLSAICSRNPQSAPVLPIRNPLSATRKFHHTLVRQAYKYVSKTGV